MRRLALTRRAALTGGLAAPAFAAPVFAAPVFAAPGAKLPTPAMSQSRDGVTVAVKDLSPRFLDFFRAAQGLSPDARFAVWKARYDFAAVPPTPQGDAMARQMLDAAWPRYPDVLPTIRRGARGMRPQPLGVACAVADLLQAVRPIRIGVTTYVGDFETNAFTNDTPEGPVVAVPLEIAATTRSLLFPHEMTHAVHMLTARLAPGYTRTLGRVVFEEGLAMRATRALAPGLPDWRYVGEKAWFDAAMADRAAVVRGLLPSLDRKDDQTVFKFTMGTGTTGREREAYVAGWLAIGALLDQGQSFPQLARVPEADMPSLMASTLDSLIRQGA